MIVVLGLGSNIGDRLMHLKQAVASLPLDSVVVSSLYESQALLKPGAPEEWNMPFINMAIKGETNLTPHDLLKAVKKIEAEIGRQARGVWAPREIDIDILAYGEEVMDTEQLTIPHAGLAQRAFALLPFAELWPDWRFPGKGMTASEMVKRLPVEEIRKLDVTRLSH